MPKKLLIVDDEASIVKGLRFTLLQDGYEVDTAYDGQEALDKAAENTYDLIVLDVMLPVVDGLHVCQTIRETSSVPIIMLTAKGEDMDKILGLEYGADDYVTKPFNILELKARIKSILRRTNTPREETAAAAGAESTQIGELEVSAENRSVYIRGKEINLTAKEFDLLYLFISNPGKVYSRENLLEMIWKYDYLGDLRTVDVHIRRLREKVEEDPSHPKYIHTKWGVGYYFAEKIKVKRKDSLHDQTSGNSFFVSPGTEKSCAPEGENRRFQRAPRLRKRRDCCMMKGTGHGSGEQEKNRSFC